MVCSSRLSLFLLSPFRTKTVASLRFLVCDFFFPEIHFFRNSKFSPFFWVLLSSAFRPFLLVSPFFHFSRHASPFWVSIFLSRFLFLAFLRRFPSLVRFVARAVGFASFCPRPCHQLPCLPYCLVPEGPVGVSRPCQAKYWCWRPLRRKNTGPTVSGSDFVSTQHRPDGLRIAGPKASGRRCPQPLCGQSSSAGPTASGKRR